MIPTRIASCCRWNWNSCNLAVEDRVTAAKAGIICDKLLIFALYKRLEHSHLWQERHTFQSLSLKYWHYCLDGSVVLAIEGLVFQNAEKSGDDYWLIVIIRGGRCTTVSVWNCINSGHRGVIQGVYFRFCLIMNPSASVDTKHESPYFAPERIQCSKNTKHLHDFSLYAVVRSEERRVGKEC